MTITPVAEDTNSTITILGQPVGSGATSEPLSLPLGDNTIEIVVAHPSGLQRTYRVTVRRAAQIAQYAYGKASDTRVRQSFGTSVALSGDTLAVGAYNDSFDIYDYGPDEIPGTVYVFRRVGPAWVQEARLQASDP